MRPHSSFFYGVVAFFSLTGAILFTLGVVAPTQHAAFVRAADAIIAVVLFLGVYQAGDRLFRPQHALDRASSLSPELRRQARIIYRGLAIVGVIGILAGAALHYFAGPAGRVTGSDLQIISGTLLFADWCLNDLTATVR